MTLSKEIAQLVVNDYFTPSIKAEVILDTLLTPYIRQILKNQCGIDAEFLTKEMSLEEYAEEKPKAEKKLKNDRGAKIDYLLFGEQVYLVELKTTAGSIKGKQADRYLRNCCDSNRKPKTFGDVFGKKLLRIVHKKHKGIPRDPQGLDKAFQKVVGGSGKYAERAKRFLKAKGLADTHKYLYTIGQILDNCPDLNGLWEKELRLIYLTPDGKDVFPNMPKEKDKQKWEELRLKWEALCRGPDGPHSSISLRQAVSELNQEEELAILLRSIITEIYPAQEAALCQN